MSTVFCMHCGHQNPAEARFCQQCGKSLTAPMQVTPEAAPVRAVEAPQKPRSHMLWLLIGGSVLVVCLCLIGAALLNRDDIGGVGDSVGDGGAGGARPTATERPTATPEYGSRENPVPKGTRVTLPQFAFTVVGVTRPATDIVLQANMFNSEPETGQEYIMLDVTVECLQSDCYFTFSNFGIIGDRNIVYEAEIFVAGVEGQLELSQEMMQGGSLTGKVFFVVGQGENILLRWEPLAGDEVWFALE